MNNTKILDLLIHEFTKISGSSGNPMVEPLPPSGSNRLYYRLSASGKSAIATVNHDFRENEAFVYMSRHFASKNIAVPRIWYYNNSEGCYLQDDLGNIRLYHCLENHEAGWVNYYKTALQSLVKIQKTAVHDFDFNRCYPRPAFDLQSMQC